ncbi:MAG TPA: lytic transglycosylase domain-containing protein [Actinomycetales bacterium]|nr:lytic transglycosylase domain-containing protein [Actinomycetales bacterium]
MPVLVAALLACGAGAAPAAADDLADARAEAAKAARQVDGMTATIAHAQKEYEVALASVGQAVIAGVAAESSRQDAARAAASARAAVGASARALYIAGGQTGVLASALDATDAHDLALRMTTAARVMTTVREEAARADSTAERAATAAQDAMTGADRAVVTADRIAARAAALQTLLDDAQADLDRLSTRARKLEEAQAAARVLAAARARAAAAAGAAAGTVRAQVPPAAYVTLYRAAAATCPGMSWTLLAAVGQVESGHGRNNGPSSAGAVGPMQFMPRTFAAYAVDGDHDGQTSPWSPADAVFTAARYLCVNGGGSATTISQALFAYNHAQWYVDLVLAVKAQLDAAQGRSPWTVRS